MVKHLSKFGNISHRRAVRSREWCEPHRARDDHLSTHGVLAEELKESQEVGRIIWRNNVTTHTLVVGVFPAEQRECVLALEVSSILSENGNALKVDAGEVMFGNQPYHCLDKRCTARVGSDRSRKILRASPASDGNKRSHTLNTTQHDKNQFLETPPTIHQKGASEEKKETHVLFGSSDELRKYFLTDRIQAEH